MNYVILLNLCDRMQFEVNCAKSHHLVISDGLIKFKGKDVGDLFTLHKSVTKLSLTIKTDDITSSRKNVDLLGRLQAAQGVMG